jgi:hypothetical protein
MQGCPNNENFFATLEECLGACRNSQPAETACDHAYDCVIVDPTCCETCEPFEYHAKASVNRERQSEFEDTRPCPDACPTCDPSIEPGLTGRYAIPACRDGRCVAHYTGPQSCSADWDCSLREGPGCCEPCDGIGIVALSSLAHLAELCDPNVDCEACQPMIPSELTAVCSDAGQCEVARR